MAVRLENGLFIATDVPENQLRNLIVNTHSIPEVRGYVLTAANAIDMSLSYVVDNIRIVAPDAVLGYDHQSAGTDIPENAPRFMRSLQLAGIRQVYLYPSGPNNISRAWIEAGLNQQLDVIVGGERSYRTSMSRRTSELIYKQAADLGVRNFAMSANKPHRVDHYKKAIMDILEYKPFTIIGTGLGPQGGKVEEFAQVAGDNWHIVVGRDIFTADDPNEKAEEYGTQIRAQINSK